MGELIEASPDVIALQEASLELAGKIPGMLDFKPEWE